MVIKSKIQSPKEVTPWKYFLNTVKLLFLLQASTVFCAFMAFSLFSEKRFFLASLYLLILVSLSFTFSYFFMLPVKRLLARALPIYQKLPYEKKVDLGYQKSEWSIIPKTLKLVDKFLNDQLKSLKDEGLKSHTLIEFIPNAVVVTDKFLNIVEYNNVFTYNFMTLEQGENSDNSLKKALWKVFELNPEIVENFEKAIKTADQATLKSYHFKKTNEYFDVAISPILDSGNQLRGALGVFHNMTQSNLANQMRVDFVANVGHELKTPLTSIKGYGQLLKANAKDIPNRLHPVLDKINSNCERLRDLFDNLLKLSQIESQYIISKKKLSLPSLLSKIQTNLEGKHLKTAYHLEFSGVEEIYGDEKLLEQVFINLIDNAIKYSDKKAINIKIFNKETDKSNIITIEDNGVGIDEKEAKRIFERFYRVQGQNKKPVEGTGLGLSIVKHIINRHSGKVELTSNENEGCTFKLTIPTFAK